MRHTNDSLNKCAPYVGIIQALQFAGKVVLMLIAIVVAFWVIGAAVGVSKWIGFSILIVIAGVLFATASRWVVWLPAILFFGVVNSLVGWVTHHAPTNQSVPISNSIAGLLTTLYVVGFTISCFYNVRYLSRLDRTAILVYLFCVIWPAFGINNGYSATRNLVLSVGIGIGALIVSFVSHLIRRRKHKSSSGLAQLQ